MKKFWLVILFLIAFGFSNPIKAQQGFRFEANLGFPLGESSDYFSYVLQGNFFYLWNIKDNVDVGLTTGCIIFLGEGNNADGSLGLFSSIPDVYLPIALSGRIEIIPRLKAGLDIGYSLSANMETKDSGGLYFRPLATYKIKEKLAIVFSYAQISEDDYNATSLSIGINFWF
ncbi:hypothetical protein [Aestuariibaculum sediminum]|uniref:Outer membrane protein beta-barrel domain-containing protein n=1 Tax=Aestuariibaculum sediminum TaxID=2770637 RepID=A0A8J6Q0M4_9FLAO|nr:hypothetical protein [Aestuariibaculum sediminum]MBD0830605.1 hypothetical protein [Aestuariibaculum sediminum]